MNIVKNIKDFVSEPAFFWCLLILGIGFLFFSFGGPYLFSFGTLMFIITIQALGWNIIGGFTGYVDFGFAAFVGIGAYATTLIINIGGIHFIPAIFIAGAFCAIIAFLIGLVLLRLKGAYFAISMLMFLGASRTFVNTDIMRPITNASTGLYVNVNLTSKPVFLIAMLLTVGVVILTHLLSGSQLGKNMLTIEADEEAAKYIGVNTTRVKRIAFSLSSLIGGLSGGVLAIYASFINPSSAFSATYLLMPIISVLLGGGGTISGPIIGGLLLGLVREALWANFPMFYEAILGVAFVLIVFFLPKGIIRVLKDKRLIARDKRW